MASHQINFLYQAVRETWTRLRTTKIKGTRHIKAAGRVIFPAQPSPLSDLVLQLRLL